jgi:MYXO-CTERM domain-containing protein
VSVANGVDSMMTGRRTVLTYSMLLGLALLLVAVSASAMGSVQWKSTKVQEADESWKVEVTIRLGKAPDTSLIPMRFVFTPIAYYERALVDNHEGPVRRVVPLMNKQPMVESVDVGFLDPGTGKLENRTRFSFRVTRARGYEAGEYEVEIKDARSDQSLGGKTRLILDGDNAVIDRRAMVFNDEKKPKKEEPKTEEPRKATEYSPDDPAYWEGGPKEPAAKEEDRPPPASMREGGCGCHVVGETGSNTGLFATLLLGACLGLRRRRPS